MKKIKCLVVDDEALARKLLQTYIERIPYLELVATCKNPIEASGFLQATTIDLMFLDIQMPQISGVDFLKTLTKRPLVVFTTAYEKYALEGYQLDIVDYLLKPFGFDRFFQAMNKASARLNIQTTTESIPVPSSFETNSTDEKNFLLVKSEHKIHRLKHKDILYIQSMQSYVSYYTNKERILSLNTMKKLEVELPSKQFIRIHKSYIVAIDQIEMLEGNQIIVGKVKIPIGASYKDEVMRRVFK
ncbi:MAG: LytR/AlgR family response regulator transcription factor [Saprospiraceae bacterium]